MRPRSSMVVMDCRRRLAAPPTVRVHGEHRIRPHEQSDCMGAHSKGYCVRPRCLRLLPSTSEARHVPSQVREARTERFVKFLYGCHLDTALAREKTAVATFDHGMVAVVTTTARHYTPHSGTALRPLGQQGSDPGLTPTENSVFQSLLLYGGLWARGVHGGSKA